MPRLKHSTFHASMSLTRHVPSLAFFNLNTHSTHVQHFNFVWDIVSHSYCISLEIQSYSTAYLTWDTWFILNPNVVLPGYFHKASSRPQAKKQLLIGLMMGIQFRSKHYCSPVEPNRLIRLYQVEYLSSCTLRRGAYYKWYSDLVTSCSLNTKYPWCIPTAPQLVNAH